MALKCNGASRLGTHVNRMWGGNAVAGIYGLGLSALRAHLDRGIGCKNGWSAGWHSVASATDRSGEPNGYRHPGAWRLPIKPGALSTHNEATGDGDITGAGQLGYNLGADLSGSGDISNALGGLIVGLVAALSGTGGISNAAINGILSAIAALTGSGTISAANITALGALIAAVTGTGTASSSVLTGTGALAAEIKSYGDLTVEGLRDAIWNAVAANYNDSGTMGEKMNDAGSAGDPWSTLLPGSYAEGTAGRLLSYIVKILRNKTITDPVTGTITVYDDDGVTILFTAILNEDAAGTTPYSGNGADRRERLT